MKLTLLTFILMILSSFTPPDFVRNNKFLRNIFYPDKLQADFRIGSGLGKNTSGKSFDHSNYAYLLKNYVDDRGFVDYSGISKDESKLDKYLQSIAGADYERLSRYEKLAFLINAYNAFTLKLIVQNPGVTAIKDIPSEKRWENSVWDLAGENISLDALEHKRIRGDFGDPRIHFALVCAAVSCPELRREPYTGDKLIMQLDNQAEKFFSKEQNFRWDKTKNLVYLSELMDWYRHDFAKSKKGVIDYLLRFTDEKKAKEIKARLDYVDVKYLKYDWSLNGSWK